MNKNNKTVSNAVQPKAESYEMWRERKLIEELKYRQVANEANKLKVTLKERLSEGRKTLNELAVKNWLKKKQESCSEQNMLGNMTSQSPIKHVQRHIVKPKVETRISYGKFLGPQKRENIEKKSLEDKEEILCRSKSKDENLKQSDQDIMTVEGEISQSNISNKSRRTVASKSISSYDHKQIKIQDDQSSLNKQLCKELGKYLENPNVYDLSERQTHNKISFEEWLKKKNAEIRDKKEREKRLKELEEEEKKKKEEMSTQAINKWYLNNAFRMVARDKFLKNKKAKDKWALYTEMLNSQESESISESLDY